MEDFIMALKGALASVGSAEILSLTGDVIGECNTLTNQTLTFSASEQEIRGGYLNKKVAGYFTDSKLDIELTDVLFDLSYVALSVGSAKQAGADVFKTEKLTSDSTGKVTLTGTAKEWNGLGKIAWVKKASDAQYTKAEETVDDTNKLGGLDAETEYCVRYVVLDEAAERVEIPASFAPKQVMIRMTQPIFRCGESGSVNSDSIKMGELISTIKCVQISPENTIGSESTGNSTTTLKGTALAVGGASDCTSSNEGIFGEIVTVIDGASATDGVKGIAVANAFYEVASGTPVTPVVYVLYDDAMKAPRKIAASECTITKISGTATISGGVITATADSEINVKWNDFETSFVIDVVE